MSVVGSAVQPQSGASDEWDFESSDNLPTTRHSGVAQQAQHSSTTTRSRETPHRTQSVDSTSSTSSTIMSEAKGRVFGMFYACKMQLTTMMSSFNDDPIWFLGQCYELKSERPHHTLHRKPKQTHVAEFVRDFQSRLFFSYKRDFPKLKGCSITSDQGWGCTVRSAQMLAAQALTVVRTGRDFRRSEEDDSHEGSQSLTVLRVFQDMPHETCPLSIHNIVQIGNTLFNKNQGDWFGPASISRIFVELINQSNESSPATMPIQAYMALDQVIYVDQIRELCGGTVKNLLVWVPARLGVRTANQVYFNDIKEFFRNRYCVGMVGGKPRHSLYFAGYQNDDIIYYDPHSLKKFVPIDDPHFEAENYHTSTPAKMSFNCLDPSVTIGFLVTNENEFQDLCAFLTKLASKSPIVTVQQVTPRYLRQVSKQSVDIDDATQSASCSSPEIDYVMLKAPDKSKEL